MRVLYLIICNLLNKFYRKKSAHLFHLLNNESANWHIPNWYFPQLALAPGLNPRIAGTPKVYNGTT